MSNNIYAVGAEGMSVEVDTNKDVYVRYPRLKTMLFINDTPLAQLVSADPNNVNSLVESMLYQHLLLHTLMATHDDLGMAMVYIGELIIALGGFPPEPLNSNIVNFLERIKHDQANY